MSSQKIESLTTPPDWAQLARLGRYLHQTCASRASVVKVMGGVAVWMRIQGELQLTFQQLRPFTPDLDIATSPGGLRPLEETLEYIGFRREEYRTSRGGEHHVYAINWGGVRCVVDVYVGILRFALPFHINYAGTKDEECLTPSELILTKALRAPNSLRGDRDALDGALLLGALDVGSGPNRVDCEYIHKKLTIGSCAPVWRNLCAAYCQRVISAAQRPELARIAERIILNAEATLRVSVVEARLFQRALVTLLCKPQVTR